MTTQKNDLELRIESTLHEIAKKAEGKKGSKPWTQIVKEELGRLGNSEGYSVSTGGFRGVHEPEWLYDMVWYKEQGAGADRRLVEVGLVMECEWELNLKHIKYDFEKLLLANAPHRLMICYVYEHERARVMAYFQEAIRLYTHGRQGDRFLIAIVDGHSEQFICDLLVKP